MGVLAAPVDVHFEWTGETRLGLAILQDACVLFVRFFHIKEGEKYRQWQEAAAWLFTDDHEYPFSFLNVCKMLSLEPGHVRDMIKLKVAQGAKLRVGDSARPTHRKIT